MTGPRRSGGSLVSPDIRTRVKRMGEPIALFFGRLGLTPNGLTLIGFGITVVGAILAGFQLWLLAGIVVFAGGVFDMFDGTLARATGAASPLGAFMDSVFDRWGEAVVYLGIVIGADAAGVSGVVILAAAAMGAAFMVSYTRAKSEGLGFTTGTGMAAVGLMPREIRLVVLSLGLIVAGVLGVSGPCGQLFCVDSSQVAGANVLILALGIIALGATITVIQRVLHVRGQAATSGGK